MENKISIFQNEKEKKLITDLNLFNQINNQIIDDISKYLNFNEKISIQYENWLNNLNEILSEASYTKLKNSSLLNLEPFTIEKETFNYLYEISNSFPEALISENNYQISSLNDILKYINSNNNKKRKLEEDSIIIEDAKKLDNKEKPKNIFNNNSNKETNNSSNSFSNNESSNISNDSIKSPEKNYIKNNKKNDLSLGTIVEQPSREEKDKYSIKNNNINNLKNENKNIIEEKQENIKNKKMPSKEFKDYIEENIKNNFEKIEVQNNDKKNFHTQQITKILDKNDNNETISLVNNCFSQNYKNNNFNKQNYINDLKLNPEYVFKSPSPQAVKFKNHYNNNSKQINIKIIENLENPFNNNNNNNDNKFEIKNEIKQQNNPINFSNKKNEKILLTPSFNENNRNNNKNIITNFISALSKAISDETSHTEINNKNNINNNSNKMYSFSKNDKTNDIKNINKDNVLNQIQINTPSPNKNIIINHSPTFTLLKNNENVQKLYSQRILEKYNNLNLINNDIFNNNIINEINKNNQINIEEEKQYSMTDSNSNDSGSDEDDSSSNNLKFVPDWAKNKEYLTKCINEQNSNINEIVENIFGKYNIEKLNLNMIFESNNTKYTIRHSTADWKFDNSMKSINNEIINYKKLVEQQLTGFNEKTSKQLKFESNNKN